jgi:predicted nucleic acid-binding protein
MIDLEVAYAARARDVPDLIDERSALPEAPVTPQVMDRALAVAELLADRGAHRGAKPVDLIIAAVAEHAGLTILHYDSDFERISEATGQPAEWIAPAGTLDR